MLVIFKEYADEFRELSCECEGGVLMLGKESMLMIVGNNAFYCEKGKYADDCEGSMLMIVRE
jgi:hypothetical protein